jgi:hypothetical protein
MARKTVEIIEGKVERDIFGSWDDCYPGLYLESDMIESIFSEYLGKNIKVTIEEIENEE